MIVRSRRGLCLVVLLIAATATALQVPVLGGRVVDDAHLLTPDTRQRVEERLANLEQATGAQVVVLTVPSLDGDSIEDLSMRAVDEWKLGRKDVDNGVLLTVAVAERRVRIEVGYGLEGSIPDIIAGRIIDQQIRPAFREGDYAGGIEKAVTTIAGLIDGTTEAPPPVARSSGPKGGEAAGAGLFVFVVLSVFAFQALFSKGAGAWLLYVFLVPFWFVFPAVLVGPRIAGLGVLAWLVGFPLLRLLIWRTGFGTSFRSAHPGWVSTRGWSSSSGGGGWSGGGGFSGGGGSFGGGGASGGW
jgi:uncharacterized protein